MKREFTPIFILSAAAMLLLLLVQHVALPQWFTFAQTLAEASRYRHLLDSPNAVAVVTDSLQAVHGKLDAKLKAFSGSSPDLKDVSALLQALIDRARDSDIRFVKIQPDPEAAQAGSGTYPVLLEMTTTFHALEGFVAALERSPHVFHIERIALTARSAQAIETKILVTGTIRAQQ